MNIDLNFNVFDMFDKSWGLLSAGDLTSHNSMTISWGNMGVLWGKPCVTVYVRHSRHTYNFTENNEYFTLSFFDEEYKKALGIMGKYSGRNVNKDKLAALTPLKYEKEGINAVIYKEAKLSFICKKVYFDDMKPEQIPDVVKKAFYSTDDYHRIYVGEIVDIIKE